MAETSNVGYTMVDLLNTDGYGVAVQGHQHLMKTDSKAFVFMERDTPYRIRLSNANSHVCMATVEIDCLVIGTFLLHPFSKCDVERPADRPLGFIFLQSAPEVRDGGDNSSNNKKSKNKTENHDEYSKIVVIFKPETASKMIQIEHLNKTERLELVSKGTVCDLFKNIRRLFGNWTVSPTCVLLHWTNGDYDSPVDEILTAESNTVISQLKSLDHAIRKMSLVSIELVEIHIEGDDVISYKVDALPTFGKVLEKTRKTLKINDTVPLYFLSASGRYLCSSSWLKSNTTMYNVMHRDEILGKPGCLVIRASLDKPTQLIHVITRMPNGDLFRLEVVPESTIRECRIQMESVSGVHGDEFRWLFGGMLLETRRKIGYYGIDDRRPIDIVLRVPDGGALISLEMRDAVCVDGDKPVNTSEMIQREESRHKQLAAARKKQKRQGNTSLRGRIQIQYMEVDPVDTDDQFITKLALTIIPKEKEEDILNGKIEAEKVKIRKACSIS